MKLVLSLWFAQLAALAFGAFMLVTCHADKVKDAQPTPAPQYHFPNVLDSMPQLVESIDPIDDLIAIVNQEISEKESNFIH